MKLRACLELNKYLDALLLLYDWLFQQSVVELPSQRSNLPHSTSKTQKFSQQELRLLLHLNFGDSRTHIMMTQDFQHFKTLAFLEVGIFSHFHSSRTGQDRSHLPMSLGPTVQ